MKHTKVVAIFGYNNSRVYDVKSIKKKVDELYQAEILLIKEGIGPQDLEITPYCLDHRPEDPLVLDTLENYLACQKLQLLGCLPFSDKGVVGASHAAASLGLHGDDCLTSFAMLDKNLFRKLERELGFETKDYKKPFFDLVHSEKELRILFQLRGKIFLKPVAEGNSRGCMKIEDDEDLQFWCENFRTYFETGVVCEEILANKNEYSFDGVDGKYWVTEKFTTEGAFRAEYQHVVPAPLSVQKKLKLEKTLLPLLQQLGSRGGAFHHEFFILDGDQVASVEPNRRPAGMWIWDLASWAFEDFDPWSRWIKWSVGMNATTVAGVGTESAVTPDGNSQPNGLIQKSFAGVRGVMSKKSGKVKRIETEKILLELEEKFGSENLRLSVLKEVGQEVASPPRDNSDFLAFIALRNPIYEDLLCDLNEADALFLRHLEVSNEN